MRKHLALVAAIAGFIVGIGVAFATLAPQGVRTSQAKEISPAAAYTPSGARTPVRIRSSTPTSSEEVSSP